jgi:prepilin peptidase CpaA
MNMTAFELFESGAFATEIRFALVIVLVLIAMGFDLKSRRIPNWLVVSGLLISLAFQTLAPSGMGIAEWSSGLAVGFFIFIPLYILRAMGAGDVKLMAAVGGFFGASAAFAAVLLTLAAGGLLGLAYALLSKRGRILLANLRFMATDLVVRTSMGEVPQTAAPVQSAGQMPYAVAIAAGTLLQIGLAHSGHTLFT